MTTEQKFHAAVNVIRSLPKNGSYQPSNELMLRFYGFYKQATEGPCIGARPAFWDIVGRAKYDAWKKLGSMPKTEAMSKYVDELHAIVETMSYSDKVANFLETPTSELDSIPMNDLELVAGDIMEKVRSQSNSPLISRDTSPVHYPDSRNSSTEHADDESDEEYIDTIEAPDTKYKISSETNFHYEPLMNGILPKAEHISRSRTSKNHTNIDITTEITRIVQNLQLDIDDLQNKIQNIERNTMSVSRKNRFFGHYSPALFTFIVVWPFICTFVMNRYLKK